jgi:magnesium transporter
VSRQAKRIHRKTSRPPAGSRPGTLVLPAGSPVPRIRCYRYDAQELEQLDVARPSDLKALLATDKTCWVDVQGFGDEALLREIAELFSIHPLALEDVVHFPQRPKTEEYEKHRYLIFRIVRSAEPGRPLETEQVSLFFDQKVVLTFQEQYGDCFDPVRQRLISGKGPMRKLRADYMAYALVDAAIDGFYPVLETLGEELERLEHDVAEDASPVLLRRINEIRRELMALRRLAIPQRDAINALIRDDQTCVTDAVRVYLRDSYDHCVHFADGVETLREIAGGLLNTYLSAAANKTNEVMKVLTIMASIFIPLTFLAGIYGMNFEHMPELHARWGYPVLLIVMLGVGLAMLVWFQRLGWLGRKGSDSSRARDDGQGTSGG